MNIIFLDIHGVMNTNKHKVVSFKHAGHEFDPKSVANLKQIINITNSKIVITSSIRLNKSIVELREIFSHYDLANYVVGKTPKIGNYRSLDIDEYITQSRNSNRHQINKFIIFDDAKNLYNAYFDRLILIDENFGINEEAVNEAIDLLKEEV